MRATIIRVHNGKELEVFVERRRNSFELWIIGGISGNPTILDHHLTHDNLEEELGYAAPRDLVWYDAVRSNIPQAKHRNAIEMEQTIKRGTFWDYKKLGQSITAHFGAIALLPSKSEETVAAKRLLFGNWEDRALTLSIARNRRLAWSCQDANDPLNVGYKVHGYAPNSWSFAKWRLHLMNSKHKCGTHVGVLNVDAKELHLEGGRLNCLARVFCKV